MDLLLKQEEIASTVLEEVANVTAEEIAAAAEDLVSSHARKEDKVFGPMTELEKRIFAVIIKKSKELKQKDPRGISRLPFGPSNGILGLLLGLEHAEAGGVDFEGCNALTRDIDFLKLWLAYIVPGRLGIKENFVLRAGFQIALLKEKEDDSDDDSCDNGHEVGGDLCAQCPYSDTCSDSPYKTGE